MDRYIDGFVIPIAKDKLDDYVRIARQAGTVWREHGALEYWECVADDLHAKDMVAFDTLAGAQADETVVFSWIVYESREHRDRVNAAVLADPRIGELMAVSPQPFDCGRMAYGGFRTLVALRAAS